ncbi:hypothetical protein ABWH93_16315 [Seohaeicola saemankumensis]|uniref:hypothetical protein n=1 Tax=Seohaeicola TaxID=481178 RepID=UPI0035CF0B08
MIRQIVSITGRTITAAPARPDQRTETRQMKNKRWIKSVLETAKAIELEQTSLPWQRGRLRAAMVAKRRAAPKLSRRA